MQKNKTAKNAPNNDSLLKAVIIAGLFWVVYTLYIDDFLANELRLLSSVIAEKLLTLFNIAIERQGNVLFRDELRFEVIAACSGSTILKIMLGSGIFLSLSWSGLSRIQRAETILLAAAIAIFANGIRVTILVLLGIERGAAIPEGTLHNIIGILTFITAFTLFCLICFKLSRKADSSPIKFRLATSYRILLTILILIILYLPFIHDQFASWLGTVWDSSNRLGVLFYIIPALLILLQRYKQQHETKVRPNSESAAEFMIKLCIILGLLCGVVSHILGVIILSGIGLLILAAALLLRLFPLRQALLTLPLLSLPLLGFPRISLRLRDLIPTTDLNPETARFLLLLAVASIQQLIYYTVRHFKPLLPMQPACTAAVNRQHSLNNFIFYSAILALTVALIFPAGSALSPLTKRQDDRVHPGYNLPYYLHNWIGTDIPLSKNDIAYFGQHNILYRNYRSIADKELPPVELLITFSAGDRHKNHPPEFCQSGAGWEIISRSAVTIDTIPAHTGIILTLTKKNRKKYLLYYFSTQGRDESNYSQMMLSSIAQILSGTPRNWATVRIFSSSRDSALQFAQHLSSPLLPDLKTIEADNTSTATASKFQ